MHVKCKQSLHLTRQRPCYSVKTSKILWCNRSRGQKKIPIMSTHISPETNSWMCHTMILTKFSNCPVLFTDHNIIHYKLWIVLHYFNITYLRHRFLQHYYQSYHCHSIVLYIYIYYYQHQNKMYI